ncbi:MAG: sulfite exporter TauE/SafE family protein [Clostridia bacterium]
MLKKIKEKFQQNIVLRRTVGVICSLFVGCANGFFGGGGGMLVVPQLTYLAGMPANKAHATAVATILPLSLVSAIIYIVNGSFVWQSGLIVGGGVLVGGIVGALLLKKISNNFLQLIFNALMLVAGIKMIIGK